MRLPDTSIENANLQKSCYVNETKRANKTNQKWIQRINNRIQQLRKDISQIEQINSVNSSRKMRKNSDNIKAKYNIQNERSRKTTSEKLKQKLLAYNNRLKRYKERQKQFQQNRDFVNSLDKFYKELRGTNITIEKVPITQEVESFWKPIWEPNLHTINKLNGSMIMKLPSIFHPTNLKPSPWRKLHKRSANSRIGKVLVLTTSKTIGGTLLRKFVQNFLPSIIKS